MNEISIEVQRPRGLVPGTREWLVELEGPRLVSRLVNEVHASPVGEMTPTQARCAAMLMDRILPAMSAVHHTIEGDLAKKTEDELKAELRRLLNGDVTDVEAKEAQSAPDQEQQTASN